MSDKNKQAEDLEACLPQTQCEMCEYPGCRPYAEAIATGDATIDRCHPGGLQTLQELAQVLDVDYSPYVATVKKQTKPAQVVRVVEDECIGCTKCIQACPVDAIIGAAKLMHVVLEDVCTGCELCIEPCPVDCIDIVKVAEPTLPQRKLKAQLSKQRYEQRNDRLDRLENKKNRNYKKHKKSATAAIAEKTPQQLRSQAIENILARAQKKPKQISSIEGVE